MLRFTVLASGFGLLVSMLGCNFEGTVITSSGGDGGTGTTVGGSGGTGGSMFCDVPADCGPSSECATHTCEAGQCVTTFTDARTPVAAQVSGDCKVDICDGAGNVVVEITEKDLPADEECRTFSCSEQGDVIPTNLGAGELCGMGLSCDGNGSCSGCTMAAQCPEGNECRTAICKGGLCDFDFATAGTVIPGNPPNDCKQSVCNAQGTTSIVNDDTDVPATDSEACTIEMCSNGIPQRIARQPLEKPNPENGVPCNGVCQANTYAGTCGLRLAWRAFPAAGGWSTMAVSSVWTGVNAPPPAGIVAAEETSDSSRLMVWSNNGNYYEFRAGVWQTPVSISAQFATLTGSNISAALSGHYGGAGEILIVSTNEAQPRACQYNVLSAGLSPQGCTNIANEQVGPPPKPNAPPQHSTPLTWSMGEQRGAYGSTPDAQIAWKGCNGRVYENWGGDFSYPYPSTLEASSPFGLNGGLNAPSPNTVVAAFYRASTDVAYFIAP